jgi:AcrR family transcriptional regulator
MPEQRRYDMTGRTRSALDSRRRALEAAYQLLETPGTVELGLEAVAARAGVTRATLYNQFGSRAALLVELFKEVGLRAGSERIYLAMRLADPTEATLSMLRESTRGLLREQQVIRKLLSLTTLDAELSREVQKAEQARRRSLLHLAKRLAQAERISVSPREASALLAGLTSFHALEAFAVDASPALVERRLLLVLERSLGLKGART